MPKKWGVNSKAEEAREKEKHQKKEKKIEEEEKKEAIKWVDNDKNALSKLERKKETEQKKNEELQRKLENKKLYEEEMASFTSNKQSKSEKLTKAQIKKNQEELLLKAMEKKLGIKEGGGSDSDSDLEPNPNHIQRENAEQDAQNYSEVIDAKFNAKATGIEDALGKLGEERPDKHPEKRVRAAFEKYSEEQLVILRKEYPSLKRSQLMEMIHKNVNLRA